MNGVMVFGRSLHRHHQRSIVHSPPPPPPCLAHQQSYYMIIIFWEMTPCGSYHLLEDDNHHSHRHGNLKSYNLITIRTNFSNLFKGRFGSHMASYGSDQGDEILSNLQSHSHVGFAWQIHLFQRPFTNETVG
jgi:hypothetical protein